ncbi:hypothetical protein VNO80_10268 [Phaseolus coccineus]|uniref:Uncharacterized protein n=1 Tax=Phaseolus coccineus TaxID=3886 RepID=A0AAN9ND44_PHACN
MGLGAENGKVVEPWDVCKSKGRRKKKGARSSCSLRMRFIGSCISSRSKVDTSISGSGTSTHYGNHYCSLARVDGWSFRDNKESLVHGEGVSLTSEIGFMCQGGV